MMLTQREFRGPAALWASLALLCSIVAAASGAQRPTTLPSDVLAVDRALADLQSGDWILQWDAMTQLSRLKTPQAVAPLKAILASKSHPWVRARALVTLARIDGAASLQQAQALASDQDPALRAAAVEALGLTGSPSAKGIIEKCLADEVLAVRAEAIVACARLERAAAWEMLNKALADKEATINLAAVRGLVYVGTDQSWAMLIGLLDHKRGPMRQAAALALREVHNPVAIPALLARISAENERHGLQACRGTLETFDPADLEGPLLKALDGQDATLYPIALTLLANNPTKAVCDRVAGRLPALQQGAPEAMPAALKLLSQFDPEAYAKPIAGCITHKSPEVRRGAIEAIARSQERSIDHFALLRDLLVDEDKTVRAAAYQALRRATRGVPQGGIVAYLAKPLASADRAVYLPALELLRERLPRNEVPQAIAALDRFLGSADKDIRKLAAATLEPVADEQTFEQVARAQGYPVPWMVIGPFNFDPSNKATALATPFPPEQEIDLRKTCDSGDDRQLAWAQVQTTRTDGLVDLSYIYQREGENSGQSHRVAYGLVSLTVEADTPATVAISAKSVAAMWLNGQKIGEQKKEDLQAPVLLKKGSNTLLVKAVAMNAGGWWFRVQVLDKDGRSLRGMLSGVPQANGGK